MTLSVPVTNGYFNYERPLILVSACERQHSAASLKEYMSGEKLPLMPLWVKHSTTAASRSPAKTGQGRRVI
jgi:hypothetical protein